MCDHNRVAGAEAVVGGLLTYTFLKASAVHGVLAHRDGQTRDNLRHCADVAAHARRAVQAKAAAQLSGTAALVAAYNRNRATA
jgi:hypothetical protein